MEFIDTSIADLFIVQPRVIGDDRGYFVETYKASVFDQRAGHRVQFIQDNESMSSKGVFRGLHFQRGVASQAKLVRVSEGRVLDIAVDLRQSSPTFLHHEMVELSSENHRQLFIPRGFAHGFLVLSDRAIFQYKVDNIYCPEAEVSLRYDDDRLGIKLPSVTAELKLSPKDLAGISLDELKSRHLLFD